MWCFKVFNFMGVVAILVMELSNLEQTFSFDYWMLHMQFGFYWSFSYSFLNGSSSFLQVTESTNLILGQIGPLVACY